MPSLGYWLATAGESVLSLAGIRATYDQPAYSVLAELPNHVEIRDYQARTAVETTVDGGRDGEAFSRLFAYITGANAPASAIPMTIPVELTATNTLRFFLPRSIASHPPAPTNPMVRIVELPAGKVAARRFSGTLSASELARQDRLLRSALSEAGWRAVGATARFGYDPPFTPPFLRRNEVVVAVAK